MAEHTPGPWRVAERTTKTKGFLILGGHARGVANVRRRPDYMPEERVTDEANARLIAAAPDMHEALRESVKQLDTIITDGTPTDFQSWLDDLNRVIAKAEGR